MSSKLIAVACAACLAMVLFGCTSASNGAESSSASSNAEEQLSVSDISASETSSESEAASEVSVEASDAASSGAAAASDESSTAEKPADSTESSSASDATEGDEVNVSDKPSPDGVASAEELRAKLNIWEDYRTSFVHGEKGGEYQKYIVLHDTEGEGDQASVINYWDSNGAGVAAHFIVGKDGSIAQCVPMDKIAHHAGFGDAGHNELYGVEDESRDDKVGTIPIGSWAPDYGMNSYSIGIEMVHVGGSGYYPEEQLAAVDALIAYIDAYYGFESEIIDHKAWRSGNSDTSPEFAEYLANYKDHRTHN